MRQRDWAVVLWIAFLAAAAGFFVLFGLIDPLEPGFDEQCIGYSLTSLETSNISL